VLSFPSPSKTMSLIRCLAASAVAMSFEVSSAFRWLPLLVGDRDQLFECRHARADLEQTGLAEVANPFTLCHGSDVGRVARRQDDPLDLFADRHHLLNAAPSFVTVAAH